MMPASQSQQQSVQPTSSEGVHNNNGPPRTYQKNQQQVLPHVWLLVTVRQEDIMAQISEICELGIHGVELINGITEDIDVRNIISSPMIRKKHFILGGEKVYSSRGLYKLYRTATTYAVRKKS